MNRAFIILTLITLSLLPLTYAASDFAYNRLYDGTQPIDGFNYSINVNSSENWVTEIGSLSTVNATQFSNEAGVLNLIESWVDSLWCRLTGCTMTGDLTFSNAAIQNPNYVQFNTTFKDGSAEGRLQWNTEDGTLEVGMPGGSVNLQIGQEMLSRSKNDKGSTIFDGQVVYISGAEGGNLLIDTPIATNITQATRTFAVATESIDNNQMGFVTTTGVVRGIDTTAWNAGDLLWLSETEEGNLTTTIPTAPNTKVAIGIVRKVAGDGEISVDPTIIPRLISLSDVYPFALTNNSIVQYVAENSRFEMTTTPFFNGITMNGTLNMDGNIIDNIFQLSAQDGSAIAFGNNPIYDSFSGLDQAIIVSTNQSLAAGEITHAFLDTNGNRVIAAWQVGKNNSGQYTRNSGGYFPDLGLTNVSILTNMEEMWTRFGILPFAGYFSAENKTSLAILWALESQKLFLHDDIGNGQLFGEGDFTWVARDGTDIDLYNGDGVHIQNEEIKEFGFSTGDNITSLNANFNSGLLLPFVRTTDAVGGILTDWRVSANAQCHDGDCASALGGSGSPLRSMQANLSSIDQDNLNLSWWLTVTQGGGDSFTVDVNNNEGSGDVNVFSTGLTIEDEYQSVILPSSMDNRSIVTVIFNYQGNNPSQDVVFVDEILVVGNATATTLANVTVFDANLDFGDKTCGIELSAEDGYQDLNISCDNINLIGNVTSVDVTEVSINVTENVTIGDTIFVDNIREHTTDNGITIWDDVTLSNMTEGSVLFAGTDGLISQDNSNFSFTNINNKSNLGIGVGNSPGANFDIRGKEGNNQRVIRIREPATISENDVFTISPRGSVRIDNYGEGDAFIINQRRTDNDVMDISGLAVATKNIFRTNAPALTSGAYMRFFHSTSTMTGKIFDLSAGQSGGAFTGDLITFDNAGTIRFGIDDLGNTGIGQNYDVNNVLSIVTNSGNTGGAEIIATLSSEGATNGMNVEIGGNYINAYRGQVASTNDYIYRGYYFDGEGTNERFHVKGNGDGFFNGNVGIGQESSSTEALRVITNGGNIDGVEIIATLGNEGATNGINVEIGSSYVNAYRAQVASNSDYIYRGYYFDGEGTNERFYVKGNGDGYFAGDLGLGTNNAQNALDVSGAQVIGSSYAGVNTAPTDGLLIEGDVGIGTVSPSTKLDVNGNTTSDFYFLGNGAYIGYNATCQMITYNSTGGIMSTQGCT